MIRIDLVMMLERKCYNLMSHRATQCNINVMQRSQSIYVVYRMWCTAICVMALLCKTTPVDQSVLVNSDILANHARYSATAWGAVSLCTNL